MSLLVTVAFVGAEESTNAYHPDARCSSASSRDHLHDYLHACLFTVLLVPVGLTRQMARERLTNYAATELATQSEEPFVARLAHEPVGVVGCVTPWNYPLMQVSE